MYNTTISIDYTHRSLHWSTLIGDVYFTVEADNTENHNCRVLNTKCLSNPFAQDLSDCTEEKEERL